MKKMNEKMNEEKEHESWFSHLNQLVNFFPLSKLLNITNIGKESN